MVGVNRRKAVIGYDGVLVATCSLGVIMLGLIRLAMPQAAPSAMALIMLWALAGVMILCLCRLPMPAALRASLVIGLIGTSIALAATGDLFGARAVGNRAFDRLPGADASAAPQAQGPLDADPIAPAIVPSRSAAGAHIEMAAAPDGDGGWARAIGERLDGRLGGAPASGLAIAGDVSGSADPAAPPKLSVAWSIAAAGTTVRCGVTTVRGAAARQSGAALVDRLAVSFYQAISRSIALGKAACA